MLKNCRLWVEGMFTSSTESTCIRPAVVSVASSTPAQTDHTEEGERRGSRHLADECAGDAGRVAAAENEIDIKGHGRERCGTWEARDRITE